MGSAPLGLYRVVGATGIDDLVIWAAGRYAPVDSDDVLTFFARRFGTYRPGPSGVDSGGGDVLHLWLDADDATRKAFLYLQADRVEFHFPEVFFVSGDGARDSARLDVVRTIVNDTAKFLGLTWTYAEFGGEKFEIEDPPAFWTAFVESLFSRVEYDAQ